MEQAPKVPGAPKLKKKRLLSPENSNDGIRPNFFLSKSVELEDEESQDNQRCLPAGIHIDSESEDDDSSNSVLGGKILQRPTHFTSSTNFVTRAQSINELPKKFKTISFTYIKPYSLGPKCIR